MERRARKMDFTDKTIDVEWRLDRCLHNLKHHEKLLKYYKDTLRTLAREKFFQQSGLQLDQEYEFVYQGKTIVGTLVGVKVTKKEYMLVMMVKMGKASRRWYIAPEQITTYEAIPQNIKESVFKFLERIEAL